MRTLWSGMRSVSTSEFSDALEALDVSLPLVLAVSGGPDSIALMRLAAQWADNRSVLPQIYAVTVDHGMRPESVHEARQVATWAAQVGIQHQTLSWQGEKPESNLQSEARDARYRLLSQYCLDKGSTCLAIAHHMNDQAETFLLRLARGSGIDGLAAVPKTREITDCDPPIRLIRPLLSFSRERLRATLMEMDQGWIDDPSNDDARFARVKARKLKSTFEDLGLTQDRILATSSRMAQAREALAHYRDDLFSRAVRVYPAGYCTLDRHALLEAPREVGLRCLSKCLRIVAGAPYGPRYERLERLYASLGESEFAGKTLHGCQLSPHQSTTLVYREFRSVDGNHAGLPEKGTVLWDRRFWVGWEADARLHSESGKTWTIRAVGENGLSQVKAADNGETPLDALPRALTYSLPSIWSDEDLVLVPFGLFRNEEVLPIDGPEITFRLRVGA